MKGIIIYAGKYGATQQYAGWLANTLNFSALATDAAKPADLAGCDLVILGSSVYMGKLVIAEWMRQHAAPLKGKTLLLFIVCASSGDNPAERDKLLNSNLDPAIRKVARIFFLPGRCIISKLNWKDRLLLRLGSMLVQDRVQKAGMRSGFDRMDRKALDGLINEVRLVMPKF